MPDRRHEIESLLVEGRTFEPVPDAVHVRNMEAYRALAAEAKADPGTFWGRLARELHVDQALRPRDGRPAARRDVVRRRRDEPVRERAGPPRRGRARRPHGDPVGGRARGGGALVVPAAARGDVPVRGGADVARRAVRRPRRDLPADDPRGGGGHARVRADRRGAHGDLRRVLGAGGARPRGGRGGLRRDHGRRRLAEGEGGAPQARGRRSRGGPRVRAARPRRTAYRDRGGVDAGPRPLVARGARARPGVRARGAPAGRAPAVHPLHVGHHRQAEGHPAHDRRLHGGDVCDGAVGLRPAPRRRLLVHGGRRLGDGALLRRLRHPAERRDDGDVRRGAGVPGARPLLVDRRAAPRDGAVHGAHGDPRVHAPRRRVARAARPLDAATPRLGGGAHQPRGLDVVPPP